MKINNGVLVRVYGYDIVDGSITIPDSVTSIGSSAFSGCSSITSVTIPNSVTSIGSSAFSDCYSLTSVTIPNSVTRIGSSAFSCCGSLTSVYITDIAAWCNISFGSYYANPLCYAHNLYLNNELITELTIPDGVTSICNYAFGGCSSLTSVTIGSGVTSIGDYAFSDCSSLTSVTIGNSVTSIGDYAFYYCRNLMSVKIGNGVESIGSYAFSGCSSLKSSIDSYKAFDIRDNDLYCRDKHYKDGARHFVSGELLLCKNGIHFCTNLFEISNYYCGEIDKDIAIYKIKPGTKILHGDTSKCCTNSCVLEKRLYREDVLKILSGESIK